jgi:arylsulfatase A-like enzyme
MKRISILLLLGICLAFGLASCGEEETPAVKQQPNILLIIADDLGKDALSGFTEGSVKPNTPNINAIRTGGISFSNMWVHPTCTPTRSSIITGKYGYRTGVKWAGDELSSSETTLQKYISTQTGNSYATALIGKWHLSGTSASVNPETFGIDYYAGIIRGSASDYYQWQFSEDGVTSQKTTYITETFTDLAIDWVGKQSKPWFLWLAYTAPHTPFHVPPSNMHKQGNLPPYTDSQDPLPYYMAAIEAMDFQIGRLLESMTAEELANTVIIFVGDNGTPNTVAQLPYSTATAKGTLYQGGVNVPLFISGKGVSRIGATDQNLITDTDLFATIAEIAGVNTSKINDSQSFKTLLSGTTTLRSYQYSEMDDGIADAWVIRNSRYKLFVNAKGGRELYDLQSDPYEKIDLMKSTLTTDASNAKAALEAELLSIRK